MRTMFSPEDFILPSKGKTILPSQEPLTSVLRYHHVAIGVTDISIAKEFYSKLGFLEEDKGGSILKHVSSGLFLHLIQASSPKEKNENILMDRPTEKHPGHTHIAFCVPTVPGVRDYLESECHFPITGERVLGGNLKSIFIRDPNRTTLEFEKNVGEMIDFPSSSDPKYTFIGDPKRPIDHVGTRVNEPMKCYQWYAKTLGFNDEIMHYEVDEEKLKGDDRLPLGRPWIARTQHGIDINLIINGNLQPPTNDTSNKNVLINSNGEIAPGILYIGCTVPDIEKTCQAFEQDGTIEFLKEEDIHQWGLKNKGHVFNIKTATQEGEGKEENAGIAKTIFVRDPNGSLWRLVQET